MSYIKWKSCSLILEHGDPGFVKNFRAKPVESQGPRAKKPEQMKPRCQSKKPEERARPRAKSENSAFYVSHSQIVFFQVSVQRRSVVSPNLVNVWVNKTKQYQFISYQFIPPILAEIGRKYRRKRSISSFVWPRKPRRRKEIRLK